MYERHDGADEPDTASRAARWLRVLKLALSICLLALGIWNALTGGPPVGLP